MIFITAIYSATDNIQLLDKTRLYSGVRERMKLYSPLESLVQISPSYTYIASHSLIIIIIPETDLLH